MPIEVVGLHVHHGLQDRADEWLAHLKRQARRWRASGLPVSLQAQVLAGRPAPGDSIEAWARRERYAALGTLARAAGVDVVMLAHHRQDQAETFLLQALRGAGPAGLAAMPLQARRDGITWLRPWLGQPTHAIDSYIRRHRLRHIEDPSNAIAEHARNRLRLAVWPPLVEHFEQAALSLAASAHRAQEAADCLRELSAIDLAALCAANGRLDVAAWSELSAARRSNALRAWLARWLDDGVPESLVQRLSLELPKLKAARWPLRGGELRVHDGRLQATMVEAARPVRRAAPMRLDLSQPGAHPVDEWGGSFEVLLAEGQGLAPEKLRDCELRARRGGERFQRAAASLPRSLKKQYQAARVPQWDRVGPLVYGGGELLFVPGLGIDGRRLSAPGTHALELRWRPAQGQRAASGR